MNDYTSTDASNYKLKNEDFLITEKAETPSKIKHNQLLKNFWTAAEIVGSVITACILFFGTIWFVNKDFSFLLTQHHPEPVSPSIVWFTEGVELNLNKKISCLNGSKLLKCNVFLKQSRPENPGAYLFYAPCLHRFPLPRDDKVLWGLFHDESPINNLVFVHERALNLFNYSATFSRTSDVPCPLMSMKGLDTLTSTRYFVETQKKNFHRANLAPVVYLQSNLYTSTERLSYVQELMRYIQVDSYGASIRNKKLPIHQIYTDPLQHSWDVNTMYKNYLYDPELLQFLARYKFMVTIENAVCNDYISEKLWRALELGVVPIYFGSPLVKDWLPNNNSAILVRDYATPEQLSRHLLQLLQNDTAYEEYLEHKTVGKISNQKLIDEITLRPYQNNFKNMVEKFECFICEKLHGNISDDVHMMTRKQFDCPPSESALSATFANSTFWLYAVNDSIPRVEALYEEIRSPDRTPRVSNTNWRPY